MGRCSLKYSIQAAGKQSNPCSKSLPKMSLCFVFLLYFTGSLNRCTYESIPFPWNFGNCEIISFDSLLVAKFQQNCELKTTKEEEKSATFQAKTKRMWTIKTGSHQIDMDAQEYGSACRSSDLRSLQTEQSASTTNVCEWVNTNTLLRSYACKYVC